MILRRTIALLLVTAALVLAAAATAGRRTVAAAEASAVHLGEYGDGIPQLGDADPFEPFAFAVVGPLRGSHAALDRALSKLDDAGDLRAIVLLGDVLADAEDGDVLPLATVLASSRAKVAAVAGETDLRRLDVFQRHVSAPDWSFRDRDCLFTTWGPGSQGNAERVPSEDVVARFLFTTAPDTAPQLEWTATFAPDAAAPDVAVQIVRVGANASLEREAFRVSRAPSVTSLFTDLSVGVLHPIVGGTGGLIAVLLAAAAMVFAALRLLRAGPDPSA